MALETPDNLEDAFTLTPAEAAPPEETNAQPPVQGGTPSAPAGEPSQPAASSLPASLLSRAQAAGLTLDGITDGGAAAEHILDRYLQDRAYAEYGRSSLASAKAGHPAGVPNQNGVGQQENSDPDGQEEFDLDGHFGGLWKAPQLDEAAKFAIQNGIVQLGDDGLYQSKPGYEAIAMPILSTLNQAHVAQRQQLQGFFESNPYKAIYDALRPAFEHEFGRQAREVSQQALTGYRQENYVEQFKTDNKAWLYDQAGNLTADGQKFAGVVAELREQGINDPQRLAAYALKITGIDPKAGAAAPAGTPAPVPANGKVRDEQGRFLPAGTPAPVPSPATKQESFIDKARRQAALSESRAGGLANNPNYQVANEGELENMFTAAYRQSQAAA